MSWGLTLHDPFIHADTTVGGANSTTGVPTTPIVGAANGWTDIAGSNFEISGNKLYAPTPGAFDSAVLLRPLGEIPGNDQRVVFRTDGGGGQRWSGVLRWVSAGNFYLFHWNDINRSCIIYTVVGGAPTNIATPSVYPGIQPGDIYEVDFSVVDISPTTVSATITNLSESQTNYPMTFGANDNTSPLQVPDTRYGLGANNNYVYYTLCKGYKKATNVAGASSMLLHS